MSILNKYEEFINEMKMDSPEYREMVLNDFKKRKFIQFDENKKLTDKTPQHLKGYTKEKYITYVGFWSEEKNEDEDCDDDDDEVVIYVGKSKKRKRRDEDIETERWYGNPISNWKGWDDKKLYANFIERLENKMRNNIGMNYYKGWSNCRICGCNNGESEYLIDGKYVMPGGYLHYIEDHKIIPHKWFLNYIIKGNENIAIN
jgi:hypothetical protein